MVLSFMGNGFCRGRARAAAAAVLGEVRNERVRGLEIGGVNDEAPFVAAPGDAGAREAGEMEGQRRRREAELLADAAGRHALRPRLDEQPEDAEPRLLRERGERVDRFLGFHVSNNMEIITVGQGAPGHIVV